MMEKTPAYRRVYHAIREKIETGVYAPGTLLPPEPELEKQFAVSRTTVRHAISLLVREGRLRVRQGFGTKVLPLADHLPHYHKFHNVVEVSDLFYDPQAHIELASFYLDEVPAAGEIAEVLETPAGTMVYRLQRLSTMNGTPFSFAVNYLKQAGIPDLKRHSFTNLYKVLKSAYGFNFETGDERIQAISADFTDAQMLAVPIGAPLLLCRRVSSFAGLGVAELAYTKLRSDCYQISLHMEGMPPYLEQELEREKNQRG